MNAQLVRDLETVRRVADKHQAPTPKPRMKLRPSDNPNKISWECVAGYGWLPDGRLITPGSVWWVHRDVWNWLSSGRAVR